MYTVVKAVCLYSIPQGALLPAYAARKAVFNLIIYFMCLCQNTMLLILYFNYLIHL